MKWKDLSLKERKQIYDSVRVNNPGATYFDIKEQFDSIPAYQNGKGKTINKADLPPEYRRRLCWCSNGCSTEFDSLGSWKRHQKTKVQSRKNS